MKKLTLIVTLSLLFVNQAHTMDEIPSELWESGVVEIHPTNLRTTEETAPREERIKLAKQNLFRAKITPEELTLLRASIKEAAEEICKAQPKTPEEFERLRNKSTFAVLGLCRINSRTLEEADLLSHIIHKGTALYYSYDSFSLQSSSIRSLHPNHDELSIYPPSEAPSTKYCESVSICHGDACLLSDGFHGSLSKYVQRTTAPKN